MKTWSTKYITRYIFPMALLAVILGYTACSTQKNTFLNRNYHSITTKYNGYFNARESYRDGLKRLASVHEDNYEHILSIFRYGSTQQRQGVSSNMEIAYQKASTAIRRHSMNIRGVEYNRWIDDSYYLIARSHYFKGDYNLATLTFEYIIRQFETPLKYKSQIWVAKSYIASGQYTNALSALERVNRNINENLLDREALLLYNMVYADYHLQQQNYALATPYLEKATELARNRKLKTRLTFIQAQSFHHAENYPRAQQTYARVIKLNPDFQMAFQARINMAMAFDTRSGEARFIESELKSMLRDSKNREFRDQIYYALAQFSMRQNKEEQAIEYYNQALENYRDNRSQKGLSFLRLGEIYMDRKEYRQAAMHYDSTMTYLSREYPDHQKAAARSVLLRELSSYLTVVEREDSLQRLAAMGTSERNAVLDNIITEIQEEERLEREREQERARMRQDMLRQGSRGRTPGGEGEGGWYFYNPSAMSFGRNEFYAKWGERELEDLWRISNKQVLAFGDMGDFGMDQEEEILAGGRISRNVLMENIPTTPEKMEASNNRMATAYYNMGMLLENRLRDIPAAINSYENLINRFPEHENRLYTAYFLYNIYNNAGNTARAQIYRSLITSEFPDTDFARIISDPDYAQNVRDRQNRINDLYAQAYNFYVSGNFDRAMELTLQSDTLEKSLEQGARFSFLKALIIGKTREESDFIRELVNITESYQGTPVYEPANNLLAYLGSTVEMRDVQTDDRSIPDRDTADNGWDEIPSVFSYKPDAVHFYVMVVNSRELQVRQIRNDINTFNQNTYTDKNFNLSTLFFDDRRQLVTITNFANAQEAYEYGSQLVESMDEKGHDSNHFTGLIISVDNYPVFYQERKLDEYIRFHNAAYRFD